EHSFLFRREVGNGHQFLLNLHGRGHQIEVPLHRTLQQHVDREHAIDFVSPLEDAVDACVAIRAIHRTLSRETHASKDLYALVHNKIKNLRTVDFHDRALNRELLQRLEPCLSGSHTPGNQRRIGIVDVLARAITRRFRRVHPRNHFSNLMFYCPEVGDLRSEWFPLLRILDRNGYRTLAATQSSRTQFDAPYVQYVDGDLEPVPSFLQQVFNGHLTVVKKYLAC